MLQKNMKAWVMRRNYQSMRDSVRKLQLIWREKKNSVEEGLEEGDDGADAEGMGTAMTVRDPLSRASSRDARERPRDWPNAITKRDLKRRHSDERASHSQGEILKL